MLCLKAGWRPGAWWLPGVEEQLGSCHEFIGVVFAVRLEEKNRV
jgi:hypothetical protein